MAGLKQDDFLALGKRLADSITQCVIKNSDKAVLGDDFGEIGISGDVIKVGDEFADKTGLEEVSEFVKEEFEEKVLIKDAWGAIENHPSKIGGVAFITEDHGIKEFGDVSAKNSIFVIFDPIDGSNNLRPWRTPRPCVSTSIALGNIDSIEDHPNLGAVEVGVVKNIFTGDTFYAVRGGGAFFDGWGRLKSSPLKDLGKAIVGVDQDSLGKVFTGRTQDVSSLLKNVGCIRRLGSSVLDFANVASGEYDAFVSLGNRMILNDLAAVKLIVEEAGGVFDEQVVGSQRNKVTNRLLKNLVEGKNEKLITTRFRVLASGNETLHKKIIEKVPGWM